MTTPDRTISDKTFQKRFGVAMRYSVLVFFALIFAFPVWFMFMSSTKPDLVLLRDTSSLRAFQPGVIYGEDADGNEGFVIDDNYRDAFDRVPLLRFIFNSVLVTVVTVTLALFVNSLAAYSFAVLRWWGKQIVLSVVIATFIVPFETIAIPLLLVVNELPWIDSSGLTTGWLDSYHVQIIPFIADALTIFLFYQFFKSVPWELVEAARIDGAGWFQIYYRVFVPISGPVFATAAILKFLAMYNQYLWPVITIRSEEYRPVMVGLQYFFQLNTAWGEIMAYLSIITLPVLIFYLSLQRAFIESIASSGIKG